MDQIHLLPDHIPNPNQQVHIHLPVHTVLTSSAQDLRDNTGLQNQMEHADYHLYNINNIPYRSSVKHLPFFVQPIGCKEKLYIPHQIPGNTLNINVIDIDGVFRNHCPVQGLDRCPV